MITSVLWSLLQGLPVRWTVLVFFTAHTGGSLKIARLSIKRSDRKDITTVASLYTADQLWKWAISASFGFLQMTKQGQIFWASVRIFGHLPSTVVELSSRHPHLQTVAVVVVVVVPRELTAFFVIGLSDSWLYLESWWCAWLRRCKNALPLMIQFILGFLLLFLKALMHDQFQLYGWGGGFEPHAVGPVRLTLKCTGCYMVQLKLKS